MVDGSAQIAELEEQLASARDATLAAEAARKLDLETARAASEQLTLSVEELRSKVMENEGVAAKVAALESQLESQRRKTLEVREKVGASDSLVTDLQSKLSKAEEMASAVSKSLESKLKASERARHAAEASAQRAAAAEAALADYNTLLVGVPLTAEDFVPFCHEGC